MSIFIHVAAGLTKSETSGYSVSMWSWRQGVLWLSLVLSQTAAASLCLAAPPEQPEAVPADEYPLYDAAVDAKFLTSRTKVVLLERMTATRLHPEAQTAPTVAWFDEGAFFDGRLPRDLIRDFVAKNQRPSRLDARFGFGVRYRFVTGEGVPETEAVIPAIPAGWTTQDRPGDLDTIDRLAFSRVGLTLRGDQALLYVANDRPDHTGAGFLIWFVRRQAVWELYDTEVMWVAQTERGTRDGP